IHYIRQHEPKGLGHAIWCARKFIGDDPFAVLLGDDIVVAETPGLKQLINQYEETGSSVVGVQTVAEHQTDRYGIVYATSNDGRRHKVHHFDEKPELGTAPSNLAIIGHYVLTPAVFAHLDKQETGAVGELQRTVGIQAVSEQELVYA